ncbi:MAG: adenylyltransferase/cytidyltransferase family protein [Candidatus Marinimicrobia bacterium]|nr:adenylyltransferase/cytidyltransferase family protein [Candidatus Neomarinimicrobiota bacterium]
MSNKKVLVSGCYDLLHGGHIAFFKEAARYGDLYVSVGSDDNIRSLKNHGAYFSEQERVYIINAVKYVKEAFVATGSGMLDYEPEMERIKPDYFVVNHDGYRDDKKELCAKHGVELVVLNRIPEEGLPPRSSSETKRELRFPTRVCLAGGWLDQPWVSEIHSGPVVVVALWPTVDFEDRCGMASSSRKVAKKIWGDQLPDGDPEENARILFGAENPPGSPYVSGSQDQLGLFMPGVNKLCYDGKFWPFQINSAVDKETCDWLSSVLHMVYFRKRPDGYNPLLEQNVTKSGVEKLAASGELCWQSILKRDVKGLGASLTQTLKAWHEILPLTVPDYAWEEIRKYDHFPGATFSGSGGGYVIVASEEPVDGAFKVIVRY